MNNASTLELASGIKTVSEQQPLDAQELLQAFSNDFNSYLNDIDSGAINGALVLDARLATPTGSLVAIDGIPIKNSRSENVVESRSVDGTEASILRQELAAKKSYESATSAINSFRSFLKDILSGAIRSKEELRERVEAGRTGNTVLIQGRPAAESRRVIETQESILEMALDSKEYLGSRKKTVSDLYNVYKKILGNEVDTDEDLTNTLEQNFPTLQNDENIIQFLFQQRGSVVGRKTRQTALQNTCSEIALVLAGKKPRPDNLMKGALSEKSLDLIIRINKQAPDISRFLGELLAKDGSTALMQLLDKRKTAAVSPAELKKEKQLQTLLIGTVVPEIRRIGVENSFLGRFIKASRVSEIETLRSEIANIEAVSVDDEPFIARLEQLADNREEEINTLEAYRLAATNGSAEAIEYTLNIKKAADDKRYEILLENLYQIEFSDFAVKAYQMILSIASASDFDKFLEQQAQRRNAGGIDFTSEFARVRSRIDDQAKYVSDLDNVVRVLNALQTTRLGIDKIIAQVDKDFPGPEDVLINQVLKQRIYRYISLRKGRYNAQEFEQLFSAAGQGLQTTANERDYSFEENLGRNYPASRFLSERYKTVLQPLFESLRGNRMVGSELERFLFNKSAGGRNTYRISTERLAEQRDLTEIETAYFNSVELLSQFNPQFVGLAKIAPEIVGAYLENHFSLQDKMTLDENKSIDYVPMIQIGLGAQGVVAAGETARLRPEIAAQTLYVDNGDLPGGPFAVPKGPGWLLNSKRSVGSNEPSLPDVDPLSEKMTVRAYGSSLRWYVGERNSGKDTRPGSINVSADFLPQTDEFANLLYPNNEEEALALQLQAALLTKRTLFKTTCTGWKAADDGLPGDKIVSFERVTEPGKIESFSIRTDNLIVSSGLGSPNYGIDLTAFSTRAVVEKSKQQAAAGKRPYITDSLGAFELLSSRERQSPGTGKVWALWGDGNSTDTQVENLTGIFGRNAGGRELEKVYVISTGDFSNRDRYALIKDVNGKNGRANIVERVEGRVSRVELTDTKGVLKVRLYNGDSLIRDRAGNPIVADVAVAAAGFKSNIGEVLSGERNPKTFLTDKYLDYVTLPTNPGVAVADRLKKDNGVLLVGTASRSGYKIDTGIDAAAKFLQLPRDARRALQDNGAENAVAIGIRGQDTQAAMRLFIEERFESSPQPGIEVGKFALSNWSRRQTTVNIKTRASNKTEVIELEGSAPVRDDIERIEPLIEAIAFQGLQKLRFFNRSGRQSGEVSFDVGISNDGKSVTIKNAPAGIPIGVFANPYFVAYGRQAIADRKEAEELRVNLSIVNGKISAKKSSILAV